MIVLLVMAFMGLVAGSFLVLKLNPAEWVREVAEHIPFQKNPSLRKKIKAVQNPKKRKGIRLTIDEAKTMLEQTGRKESFAKVCISSLALFLVGALLALAFGNLFMLPVLAIGFALLPFWIVLFSASFYKKRLNAELETALSVITTSYLRSESILSAVEENVGYLNPPVSDVFLSFLAQSKLINSNLQQALTELKSKINNSVFQEWCDAIMACQEDVTLKTTLTPIISKLSDMRVVSAELDYLLYEPLKEFITMALLLIGNIPLLYFLNKDWFHTLVDTAAGKFVMALCALTLFISLAAVIRLTRPIEYKR